MRSCGSAAPSPKSRHHSRHRLRRLRQGAPAARVPTHTRAPGSGEVVVGASIVPASKAAAIFSIDGFMVRKPHSRIEAPGCQVPARRLESRRRTPRISLKNELKSPSECQRARRENATVKAPRSRRRWRGGRDRATWDGRSRDWCRFAKSRPCALGAMRGQFKMTEGWERALTDEEAEAFWNGRQAH